MSFGTFLLYVFLSVVIIVVGYFAVLIAIALISRLVIVGSDSIGQSRARRGAEKWERMEAELEDDDA